MGIYSHVCIYNNNKYNEFMLGQIAQPKVGI